MSDFFFLAALANVDIYLNSNMPHRWRFTKIPSFNCLCVYCLPFPLFMNIGAPDVFTRLCSLMREGGGGGGGGG